MPRFLDVDCAMAGRIAAYDWTANPLGPPEDWPAALKTSVGLILASQFPQCIVWGDAKITIPNDAFLPILGGKPDALGRSFEDVWREAWKEIGPIVERAFAGTATYIEDFALSVDRGRGAEEACFTFCYSPIRDEFGQILGMLDTVIETTGKVQAQRQAQVANHELAHRIKNSLAVFQAIARQTFKGENATAEARERFDGRISALAAAHGLAARAPGGAVPLEAVIRNALKSLQDIESRFHLSGPELTLSGRLAQSLSLAIHELATNATKFGALSGPAGNIDIMWTAGDSGGDAPFTLDWIESGGPIVRVPERAGFGTKLVTRILGGDFGGEATLSYPPEGLRFSLRTRTDKLG